MTKKTSIWWIAILAFIILSGFLGGNHLYKDLKKELQTSIDEKQLLIEQSQKKEDSLINIANREANFANDLRAKNDNLRNSNIWYRNELRKRSEAALNDIDPDFDSNSTRISNGAKRFYQQNGNPRQESHDSNR